MGFEFKLIILKVIFMEFYVNSLMIVDVLVWKRWFLEKFYYLLKIVFYILYCKICRFWIYVILEVIELKIVKFMEKYMKILKFFEKKLYKNNFVWYY